MNYLFTFLLAAITFAAAAQRKLCIAPPGNHNDTIAFRTAEMSDMLQLGKYRAVFYGGQHNGTFDPELKYTLITTLNQLNGTRDLFMEISVSAAWHFNQYLQTGDTAWLYRVPIVLTYGRYPRFWQRLYNYNKTLPDSIKFVVHGLDFERTEIFATLQQLQPPGCKIPASLQPVMDTITAHLHDKPLGMYIFNGLKMTGLVDNSAFIQTLHYIQNTLLEHHDDTRRLYGNNYPVVYDIITNKSKVIVKPVPRNKTMYSAMQRIVTARHIDRFAGFFGNMHTDYQVASALTNAATSLPGFRSSDILHIAAVVYNQRTKDGTLIPLYNKDADSIIALNKDCKASLYPATAVPGYRKAADFVIIADVQ